MPTIRFESDQPERDDSRDNFLKSLGLDPLLWGEDQEFELQTGMTPVIFGMSCEVPASLQATTQWVARITEEAGSWRFMVGDHVWAARLPKEIVEGDPDKCRSAIGELPEELTSLNLRACKSLTDVSTLAGLKNLTTLNLMDCESLMDVSVVAELNNLIALNLGRCGSLTDVSVLAELKNLTALNLGRCGSLTDVSVLAGLKNLTSLNLGWSQSLTDVSVLAELKNLSDLNLRACRSLTDVSVMAALKNLTTLNLMDCESLTDVSVMAELKNLTALNLGRCESLTDVSVLAGLKNLTSLNLGWSQSLTDVSVLAELKNLADLNLRACRSLTDVSVLAGLKNLTTLNLMDCKSLTDVSVLAELNNLADLNLKGCEPLTDVRVLAGLKNVTNLNLSGCGSIRTLDPLSSLRHLESLNVSNCLRIDSVAPLREIPLLREVVGFNPDQTAELLASTAALRNDVAFIEKNAQGWLQQIQQMDEAAPEERERFATTLGEALSLLGESPHEEIYETYLAGRPEFSASPWKAWFSGTREVSGWELMRMRAERQELTNANPGCIGGVCASLSGGDDVGKDERQWAVDWLERMEQVWADRGSELLPVAAEVCVAHLRHGLDDALGRWLLRLTDESDPASMDPVQAALGRWQLKRGNLDAARDHAAKIGTPDRRDPLLLELAKRYVAVDPQAAGELLLAISSPPMRREIMELLCEDTSFVVDPLNVERLVVACGDSAEALSGLIAKLPPETDSSLLDQLSTAVREGSRNFHSLHRSTLQRMLEELG